MRLGAASSSESKPASRCPLVLNPHCADVFVAHENLLSNKLIHSTSVAACESIMASQRFVGSVPNDDERYDGFEAWHVSPLSDLRRRVHFELRPATDGLLFPFSLYPKKLESGSAIKILTLDDDLVSEPNYSLFYVASTPTQFGADYLTVYQTHVVAALGGSKEAELATKAGFTMLDKHSNCVLQFSKRENHAVKLATIATKVKVGDRTYHNRVVLSVLGDLAFPSNANVEVVDGTKVTFARQAVACPFRACTTSCSSFSSLKVHYRAVHSNVKLFACATCKREFKSEGTLLAHRVTHQAAELACSRCSKKFKTNRALLTHIAVSHRTKELAHKCAECDLSFKWKSRLTRHVGAVHRRERKHSCDRCDKRFSQKSDLTKHVATVHDKQTFAVCDECDRGFASKGDLSRHVAAVHRAELPHECDLCERRFSLKGNLTRHIKTVHFRDL